VVLGDLGVETERPTYDLLIRGDSVRDLSL
jgi:hypothetical protein